MNSNRRAFGTRNMIEIYFGRRSAKNKRRRRQKQAVGSTRYKLSEAPEQASEAPETTRRKHQK